MINEVRIVFNQTRALTKASLKSRYRNTWSGYLWVILNPLLIYSVQSYAFQHILKLNVVNYPIYLALGILPWIFIVSTVEMSVGIFINNGRLLKSYKINPVVFMLSQLIDNFINFFSASLIVLALLAFFNHLEILKFILLIFPLISLFIFVGSFSFFCSLVQVFFRDLRFILSFLFQILFFITPIFYPEELIPDAVRTVHQVNIFSILLRPFQLFSTNDFMLDTFMLLLLKSFAVSILFFVGSLLLWKRKKNELYHYI